MTHLHARDAMRNADAETWERISRGAARSRFAGSASRPRDADDDAGPVVVVAPSLTWPMMAPILSGIGHILEQAPRELAIYDVSRRQDRVEFIERMVGTLQIEGLIAIYPDGAATLDEAAGDDRCVSLYLSQAHKQGLPVAIIDDQSDHGDVPWVSADNRQGAMDAVGHLIRLGHRRIAHISGPRSYLCAQDRLAGYRAALAQACLPVDHTLEIAGDFTAASGWAGAIYLLTLPNPPTAIFAANDDIARGALTAVRQHGLLVPWQVAVVGFDDADPMWSTEPPLTSARQPFYDMGWWAATRLMETLATPHSLRARKPAPCNRERQGHVAGEALATQAARDHLQLPVTLTQRLSSGASSGLSPYATLADLAPATP